MTETDEQQRKRLIEETPEFVAIWVISQWAGMFGWHFVNTSMVAPEFKENYEGYIWKALTSRKVE